MRNDNAKPANRNKKREHKKAAPAVRETQTVRELPEDVLIGRNAVTEALRAGRGINKILLADGDREGQVSEIVALAKGSRFDGLVNADGESFLAPERMKAAFDEALEQQPETVGDYFRCAYRSLALSYKNALDELDRNTGRSFDRIVIVGGGAKNQFLNELTAHFTAKQVIALPVEATALGNLKIQMNA